jgi:hypothetical protein
LRWPGARVTGIDFSATSVRCTEKLKRRYNLSTLEVYQLPIDRVHELERSFDHIVCTGVLHHLADPDAGLRTLRSVLKPDGAMHLMVYAPYGRTGVYMLQDFCRRLGIRAADTELQDLIAALKTLPPGHPLETLLREALDFWQEPALADALLHPQDRAYSVATCAALTSHIDLVSTFVGLTGLPESRRPATVKALPGDDFSTLLADPEKATPQAVRPGVLFDYVGVSTVDGDYLRNVMISLFMHKPSPPILKAKLDNRGLLYVAFDGRYKIGRFYSATAVNTPKTLDELLKNNDVQVFDLLSDPGETHNLALEAEKNGETILRMNELLNTLIAKEVGANDGRYLTETIGLK